MEFITELENIDFDDERIGEKIKNLAVLLNEGINVPRGFSLSGECYIAFLRGFKSDLNDLISKKKLGNISGLVRDLFLSNNLNGLKSQLDNVLSTFDEGTYFAVRSSGFGCSNGKLIIEDSDDKSLAGQYDSFLRVPKESVEDAIKLCWASLFNDRSLKLFDAINDKTYLNSIMSVTFQEMIRADYSAVMMTKDPLDKRNVLGIESTYGSCEALVSGKVTGDFTLVDRMSGKIVDTELGGKKHKIVYSNFSLSNNNYFLEPNSEILANSFALNKDKINELFFMGLRIEEIFGKPQDIEVVFSKDILYVVQSRNITNYKG